VSLLTDLPAALPWLLIGFFIGLNFRDAVDWLLLQIRGSRVRG